MLRGRARVHGRRQRARARSRSARLRPRPGAETQPPSRSTRTRSCSRSAASRASRTRSRRGRRCSPRSRLRSAGDWDEAIRIHEEALGELPEHPALLYNLACMEARGGRHLDALRHLQQRGRARAEVGEDAHATTATSTRSAASRASRSLATVARAAARRRRAHAAPARDLPPAGRRAARRRTRRPASARRRAACSPTASANALCDCSPPNGTSSSGCRQPGEHGAVGDGAHRDVGDDRLAVARRDRDRERVRARERRAAGRRRQAAAARSRSAPRRDRRPRAGAPSSRASRSGTCACRRRRARAPAARRAAPRRRLRASGSRARRRRPSARSPARRRTRCGRASSGSSSHVSSHSIRERPWPSWPRALRVEEVRRERLDVLGAEAERGQPRRVPRQAARAEKASVGQPRARAIAQPAVGIDGDRMTDRLEERHVAVGVRVRGRRGEVEPSRRASSRTACALPSPCAARSERPV